MRTNAIILLVAALTYIESSIMIFQLDRIERRLTAIQSPITPAHFREAEAVGVIVRKIERMNKSVSRGLSLHVARAVYEVAEEQEISPDLIVALIAAESNFDPYAISRTGCSGLMQVAPFWRNELAFCKDLFDVKTSIRCGTYIFLTYRGMFGSDEAALVAYNDGPETVKKSIKSGSIVKSSYSKLVLASVDRLKLQ